jgi:hypothetical protein
MNNPDMEFISWFRKEIKPNLAQVQIDLVESIAFEAFNVGQKFREKHPRCKHVEKGVRCCQEEGHRHFHTYKCSSRFCPGYVWRASDMPHPPKTCK